MVRYRESLTPSIGFHLALALALPLGYGMLAPINLVWGIVNAIAIYVALLIVFVGFAPRIRVTDTHLRAGRATIERRFLGAATVVDREDRGAALADARSWSLVRGWIPTGVSITVNDPADPTPTWYLSTRRPEKLVAALAG